MQTRRLYRSRTNSVIGGVAGGLAEYFTLDPVVVRILFVLLALVGGGGGIVYIVLWIVLPENPQTSYNTFNQSYTMENETNMNPGNDSGPQEPWHDPMRNRNNGNLVGGLVLITLGMIFLADRFIKNIDFGDLWPVLLIIIGIAILVGGFGKSKKD